MDLIHPGRAWVWALVCRGADRVAWVVEGRGSAAGLECPPSVRFRVVQSWSGALLRAGPLQVPAELAGMLLRDQRWRWRVLILMCA